jgi:type I restriction enzyme S subunit
VSIGELIIADESGFACSKSKLVSAGLPHLRPFNISDAGNLNLGELYQVPIEEAPSRKSSLEVGDILFNNTNSAELVGKSAIVGSPMTAGFSNHLTRIKVDRKRIEPLFFAFWLRRLRATGYFTANATQWVSQAAFKVSELRKLRIDVPPLSEQRRIVDVLSRAEGIVRLRREAEKKAAELIPALFLDMFGDPATNPKGWPVEKIGELGRVQLGRQRAPKYQTGKCVRPYVRVANVFEDEIDVSDLLGMDFDENDFAKYRLEHGDILLNEGQSIELVGRPAMWRDEIADCCFQNTLVRFQPDRSRMLPDFALAAMLNYYRSGALSKISSKTSNVAHLGAARFAALSLYCPPVGLQREFAGHSDAVRGIRTQQSSATVKAQTAFDALLATTFNRCVEATA